MRSVRHPFSSGRGSVAWKGLALERFEPCEAKVSRTVLRGGAGGLTTCAYPASFLLNSEPYQSGPFGCPLECEVSRDQQGKTEPDRRRNCSSKRPPILEECQEESC